MNEQVPAHTRYIREGQTTRIENDPTKAARQQDKPIHVDGTLRSHHSPKTICGVSKVDGASCRGKRTSTGKCFSHSR